MDTLNYSHSGEGIVVSHYDFNLTFNFNLMMLSRVKIGVTGVVALLDRLIRECLPDKMTFK